MAASVLNTNVLPVFYEASDTTQIIVASCSLAVLIVTAFTWLSSYPCDFAIPTVIVWALCGVYAELNAPLPMIIETFSERQINGTQYAILTAIILIAVGIVSKALFIILKQHPAAREEDRKQASSVSESEEAVSSEENV